MFDCGTPANQQFQFLGFDVLYSGSGISLVRVAGKCLDDPSGTVGTEIQIDDCYPSDNQKVLLTSWGQMKLHGLCMTATRGTDTDAVPNYSRVTLQKCEGRDDPAQIWALR
jgi:hypothetical protein